jgi:hypothetical protein
MTRRWDWPGPFGEVQILKLKTEGFPIMSLTGSTDGELWRGQRARSE